MLTDLAAASGATIVVLLAAAAGAGAGPVRRVRVQGEEAVWSQHVVRVQVHRVRGAHRDETVRSGAAAANGRVRGRRGAGGGIAGTAEKAADLLLGLGQLPPKQLALLLSLLQNIFKIIK